jgi:hypothetical protein
MEQNQQPRLWTDAARASNLPEHFILTMNKIVELRRGKSAKYQGHPVN